MKEDDTDLVTSIPLELKDKSCSGTYRIGVASYAGYIEVDEAKKNSLYYWFFESQSANRDNIGEIPLVIWLNGGPGASSLAGLFLENGPFLLADQGGSRAMIVDNPQSWNEKFHLMYWDQPVGTGFSYTETGSYVTSEEELSRQFGNGLQGFFDRHPEYRACDLYITGESYAGKYIPNMAKMISEMNAALPEARRIRLKGLGIGDGWMDPGLQTRLQIDYGYEMGFVDTRQRQEVELLYQAFSKALDAGDMATAFYLGDNVSNTVLNCGGNPDIYDVRRWQDLPLTNLKDYLACEKVKSAIHARGTWQFADASGPVSQGLINDMMADVTGLFPGLLKQYRMLFYTGNFDMSCGFTGTEQILQSLAYNGWQNLRRKVWTNDPLAVGGDVPQTQGYVKGIANLTQGVIPDAGHQVPVAKPEVSRLMIGNWILELDFPGYFPLTLAATTKWLDTGIAIGAAETAVVKFLSGHWTANPANGFVDADGDSAHQAKPGYTLPGANEGALCGRVGETGPVFLIGNGATVPDGLAGNLFLCINDDLNGEYGAGFSDNLGSVTVAVGLTRKR